MPVQNDPSGYMDILIVHAEGKDYAVAAPAFETTTGDLVEFRVADRMTLLGPATHIMTCKRFDEAWNLIFGLTRIHNAVAIYNVKWSEGLSDT